MNGCFSTGVVIIPETAGTTNHFGITEAAIQTIHQRESVSQDVNVGGEPPQSDAPCEGDIDESCTDHVPAEGQPQTGVHHDLLVDVEALESDSEGESETQHEDGLECEPEGNRTEVRSKNPRLQVKMTNRCQNHKMFVLKLSRRREKVEGGCKKSGMKRMQ